MADLGALLEASSVFFTTIQTNSFSYVKKSGEKIADVASKKLYIPFSPGGSGGGCVHIILGVFILRQCIKIIYLFYKHAYGRMWMEVLHVAVLQFCQSRVDGFFLQIQKIDALKKDTEELRADSTIIKKNSEEAASQLNSIREFLGLGDNSKKTESLVDVFKEVLSGGDLCQKLLKQVCDQNEELQKNLTSLLENHHTQQSNKIDALNESFRGLANDMPLQDLILQYKNYSLDRLKEEIKKEDPIEDGSPYTVRAVAVLFLLCYKKEAEWLPILKEMLDSVEKKT